MAAGTITKRIAKDGTVSYRVRVEIPTGNSLQRKQASRTFRTKKEAEKGIAAWLVEIEQGTAIDPSTVTIEQLLTDWLTDEAANRVQPTTLEDYTATIRKHLIPGLGSVKAQRLQSNQVQAFYADKLATGTGVRTVQLCHLRLSQALDWAVRMRVLSQNVAKNVKPPTTKQKERMIWTPEQAAQFFESANSHAESDYSSSTWPILFDWLLSTGMRRGEALALTWSDIDLESGSVKISRSVGTLAGAVHIQAPKTAGSTRVIHLQPETVEVLRKHRAKQVEHRLKLGPLWTDLGIVFAGAFGEYLYPSNVDRAFHRLVRAAGVERIRVHDLRHTFASWAMASGANVVELSRHLGHSRPSITMDLYGHVVPGDSGRITRLVGEARYRISS